MIPAFLNFSAKILISSNTLPNILPKGFIVFLAAVLTVFSVCLFSLAFSDLLKPDSATLTTIHVLFEWEQEPDAVEYNIQASNSISFNNLYINTNTENTVHIEKNAFDWENNVYWRVRPIYSDGSNGEWIDTRYFMIGERILADLNVDIYNDDLIEDGLVIYSQFAPYLATGVIAPVRPILGKIVIIFVVTC